MTTEQYQTEKQKVVSSTVPAGWKLVPVEPTQEMLDSPPNAWPADAKVTWATMLATSPTPPAEQQAAPKAAPGEPEAPAKSDARKIRLQGIILALVRLSCAPPVAPALEYQLSRMIDFYFESGDDAFARQLQLVRRGALNGGNRSKLIPSAAPQQDAQEPALFVSAKQLADLVDPSHATGGSYLPARKTRAGLFTQPLYSAPQPAPAPLSDDAERDAARYRWLREHEGADGLIRSDCRGLYLPQRDALDSAIDALLFTTPSQRGEIAGDGKPCNNDHDPDCRWPDCRCRERERMAAAIDAARKQGGA